MRHWSRRVCSAVVLTLTCVSGAVRAAEPPTAPAVLDYWPMQPGMTWIYQDDRGHRQVVHVVGRQQLDGESVTVVEQTLSGAVLLRFYYVVRDGHVMRVASERVGGPAPSALQRYTPPIIVWSTQLESDIQRQETIAVPAGTYQCLVVAHRASTGDTQTIWMAPGVGKVRSTVTGADGQQVSSVELMDFVSSSAMGAAAP